MSHGDSNRAAYRLPETSTGVAIAVAVLLAIAAIVEAAKLNSLRSTDVWGHLRAGIWILENRSVPRTGLFSQSANLPWRDFSWGFDAIVAGAYKLIGLRAVPALAVSFRVALALVLFLLAGGRRGNIWGAGLLALAGLYTLSSIGPGPTAVSVVLLGVELILLFEWRRARMTLPARFALPLLFVVWANLDLGFIYGIGVLAFYVASFYVQPFAGRLAGADESRGQPHSALILLGCVVASGITPYGYAGYPAFWNMETSVANANLPGYAAMGFRQPLDYAVLLLAMSAFLAMGLRRSHDVFLAILLGGSAMLAFHSQRETWLVTVSAVGVLGWMIGQHQGEEDAQPARLFERQLIVIAGSSSALAMLAFFLLIPRDPKMLMAKAGEMLPVRACDFIRSAGLEQPLFNAYGWGGFVTWYLPEYPVAIDSRRGLYSEAMEENYFKVMKADIPYQSLPAMKDAKTLLLERSNIMAEALKNIAGFHVAYEDEVATVLSRGSVP